MRLLMDCYWWVSGPPSGRLVVREIVSAWLRTFPEDTLVLATRPGDERSVREVMGDGVETVPLRLKPHGLSVALELARHARRLGVDAVLSQNFTPVAGWSAVFIHDVMYQTNPEWFTRLERAYFWPIPLLARRAGLVLTSSHTEASRIATCNPRLDTVVPVGLSVATALRNATPERPPVLAGTSRFLLSVGRLNRRKNLATALDGALRSGGVTEDRPLLVVGEHDGMDVSLPATVIEACDTGLVRFMGHVSDAQLAWLYAHADLFLFLSFDEGYGLPPLEALSFGCPTLVSDIPVFRELLSDCVSYVAADDVDAVGRAVARCLAENTPARVPPSTPGWDTCVTRAREALTSARWPGSGLTRPAR